MEREIVGVQTKSIHAPIDDCDGIRISTMSRHTLSDGVTVDQLITHESYDWWLKELAPPIELVGAWYKNKINWINFCKYYNLFLNLPVQQEYLIYLLELAKQTRITILCVESTPHQCHRSILAKRLGYLDPSLNIHIY